MTSDESGVALDIPLISLNGSAPHCEHLAACRPVSPLSSSCTECLSAGEIWTGLMMCLTCGWVACSNDSPGRHAIEHYEETDHPVVGALRSGPTWRWCYVHRRAV